MSLIGSLLGLAIFPLKAKRPEPPPKEVENLAAMALADEVRRTTFALNYWRGTGLALIEENERLREDLAHARRGLASHRYEGQQQAQLQQQSYQGLGQLQNYQQAMQNYALCTCVPARSEAFRNDNSQ